MARLPENPLTEVRVNGMEVPLADMLTLPEVMVKEGTGGAALAVLRAGARVRTTARPVSALLLVITGALLVSRWRTGNGTPGWRWIVTEGEARDG
jgi:hypothetical protein